jgi:hypothetical protein
MPTRATLDGLIVSTEMEESPYLRPFPDDVVLGGTPKQQTPNEIRSAVRVRSSALNLSSFAGKR